MRCQICSEEVRDEEQAQQWGPEIAHATCVTAYRAGKADERERIAAWLDADWPADGAEERYHRAWIAAKLRLGA